MRALPLIVLAGACSVGDGKGALSGTLYMAECTTSSTFSSDGGTGGAAYSMNPSFFVADFTYDLPKTNPMNRLAIRMKSSGNRIEEADVMFMNVADVGQLAKQLGQLV